MRQQDLTTGSPAKDILTFALPIFFGNILQQVYQIADTMIVGRFIGTGALAAVGATYGLYFLTNGFVYGISVGFTVLTAQKCGADDAGAARQSAGNAFSLAMLLTLVASALLTANVPGLLRLMDTFSDVCSSCPQMKLLQMLSR